MTFQKSRDSRSVSRMRRLNHFVCPVPSWTTCQTTMWSHSRHGGPSLGNGILPEEWYLSSNLWTICRLCSLEIRPCLVTRSFRSWIGKNPPSAFLVTKLIKTKTYSLTSDKPPTDLHPPGPQAIITRGQCSGTSFVPSWVQGSTECTVGQKTEYSVKPQEWSTCPTLPRDMVPSLWQL